MMGIDEGKNVCVSCKNAPCTLTESAALTSHCGAHNLMRCQTQSERKQLCIMYLMRCQTRYCE